MLYAKQEQRQRHPSLQSSPFFLFFCPLINIPPSINHSIICRHHLIVMATFYVLITAYPFPSLCTFIPLPRHFALCGNVLFALHLISLCRTRTTLESRAKLLLNRTVRNRKRFFLLSEKKTMVVFMCRYQSRTAVSLCMDNLYRRQRSIKTALTCHFPILR